jgi:hypothetical protein
MKPIVILETKKDKKELKKIFNMPTKKKGK